MGVSNLIRTVSGVSGYGECTTPWRFWILRKTEE